jgi:hypothetical protein
LSLTVAFGGTVLLALKERYTEAMGRDDVKAIVVTGISF